ncbi:MAG: hypothetical protein CVT72_03340 [Alphaproteobacteria bacterium HGW-Alphaproteobacteria-11]|nr:MAG: hypothetical protein CVT72_03340 [Alphaproteobacteria bacterium HGW-Alphaproteobacteria-11]
MITDGTASRRQAPRIWRGGEIDADPFHMPQYAAIPAAELVQRAFGFIRYATVYADAVTVNDSSPILGVFEWSEKMSAYEGIALRVVARDRHGVEKSLLVELTHATNAKRNIVLHASHDGLDAPARWRSWGRVLRLPLLVEDREGMLHPAERKLGALHVGDPQPHSGANPLSARRPLSFGQSGQPRSWGERLVVGARPPAY